MKTEKKKLGDLGEACAMLYLKQNKYKLLDCNYQCDYGEIDIVAKKGDVYVFVEVKTRSGDFLLPQDAVDKHKENNIYASAKAFLKQYYLRNVNFRFDIIEVMGTSPKDFKVNHLENAFFK